MKEISSVQNPLIKQIVQLQEKSKVRKKTGLFIIEGMREIEIALNNAYEFQQLLYCEELINNNLLYKIRQKTEIHTEWIAITKEVYQKIAYRESTEGVLAIAKSKSHEANNIDLPENPLIVVLESLEKPGNIGAILRTTDAANVDIVFIADPKTDLYNPNIIRSSVGAVFTNNIIVGNSENLINLLGIKKIPIFSAILQEAVPYYTVDYSKGAAIVMGTESVGLSELWRKASQSNIIIPMQGQIDSMNVSVAAAVIIFEAIRQKAI